jgi:hypothetical protein
MVGDGVIWSIIASGGDALRLSFDLITERYHHVHGSITTTTTTLRFRLNSDLCPRALCRMVFLIVIARRSDRVYSI